MNPQNLIRALRQCASTGRVDDVRLLAKALEWAGHLLKHEDLDDPPPGLQLHHAALRMLPELRAPCPELDAAAAEISGYQQELEHAQFDYEPPKHLRPRPAITVPRSGIPYYCEACGTLDILHSGKAEIVAPVAWGPTTGWPGCAVVAGNDTWFRLMTLCQSCRRRRLKRCHDEQYDLEAGRWLRCCELSIGPDYCSEHGRPEARRERGAYNWTAMPKSGRRKAASGDVGEGSLPAGALTRTGDLPVGSLIPCIDRSLVSRS